MQKDGQWGEFFPIELSTYAYNETVASEYFSYTKEQVLKKGWRWIDDESEKMYKGPEYQIPDDVKAVDGEICKQILVCAETGKPFKIIPQELDFCKMKGLPVPRVSPRQRHKNRMALRNSWALYERECSKCKAKMRTTCAPNRLPAGRQVPPVYCEKCYADFVI